MLLWRSPNSSSHGDHHECTTWNVVQTVLISTRYLIPVVQSAPLHMLCTYEQGTSYYPLRYSRMPNSCGCMDVPRGQGLDGPRGHWHNESDYLSTWNVHISLSVPAQSSSLRLFQSAVATSIPRLPALLQIATLTSHNSLIEVIRVLLLVIIARVVA